MSEREIDLRSGEWLTRAEAERRIVRETIRCVQRRLRFATTIEGSSGFTLFHGPGSAPTGNWVIHRDDLGALAEDILSEVDLGVRKRVRRREQSQVGGNPKYPRRPVSAASRIVILAKSEGHCFYCGVDLGAKRGWPADHFVPLSRGGLDVEENMVAACRPCNLRKSDLLLEEYRTIAGPTFAFEWNGWLRFDSEAQYADIAA